MNHQYEEAKFQRRTLRGDDTRAGMEKYHKSHDVKTMLIKAI